MLGKQVKDKITGFEGIATGKADYLYGCTQYSVAPKVNPTDGKVGDSYWFDEGSLEVTGPGITAAEVKGTKPGGPNRDCPGKSA